MKQFFTLPTDPEFFQRYAGLIKPLKKIGRGSQLISGLTEVGAIYALLFSSLVLFFPAVAPVISVIGAGIGTALLEIGLAKFAPFSVRAILYKRNKGLDLVMSIFICLGTVLLVSASGYLSFSNSSRIVDTFTPQAEQQTNQEAETERLSSRADLSTTYTLDSSSLATNYTSRLEATTSEYNSLLDVEHRKVKGYQAREKRTGRKYTSRIDRAEQKIEEIEAERDREISALQVEKSQAVEQLNTRRREQLATIQTTYKGQREAVEQFNQDAKSKRESKVESYGLGLGWFTIFALVIFLLSVTVDEVYKKGAGIEENFIATQYDFSASVFQDWTTALRNKAQQKMRARIKKIEDSTETAPLPSLPDSLYDLTEIITDTVTLKREESDQDDEKIIYLHDENRRKRSGSSNENRRGNENRGTRELRTCDHCTKEYEHRHHKQKYCTDECRGLAWEKRTGKKLRRKSG